MLQVISPCRWFRQPWKQHTYSFWFCLSLKSIIPQCWKRLSWMEMLITKHMNSLQVYTLNWQVCLNYTSLKLNLVLRKCQMWFICKLKTTKSLRPRQPIYFKTLVTKAYQYHPWKFTVLESSWKSSIQSTEKAVRLSVLSQKKFPLPQDP